MITEEFTSQDKKFVKKIIYWAIAAVFLLSGITWVCNKTDNIANNVVDNAIPNYENYQDIYNTCTKLNTDLCQMKDIPDSDKMFAQFSKAQRMNALRTNLNRWVEEYNAKSKMWNRNLWKSKELPYQLNVHDFTCY